MKVSFRDMVERTAGITKKEGEVTKWKIAYYLNRDVTTVVRYMKALAEVYPEEFEYDSERGILRFLASSGDEKK